MAPLLNIMALAAFCASVTASPLDSGIQARGKKGELKYVALGDSFSAGIGAGRFIAATGAGSTNNKCARMTKSYPQVLYNSLTGVANKFQFLSCSGATVGNLKAQYDLIPDDGKADIVTLSIGGNDFGFGDIVTNCVYPYKGMKDTMGDDNPGKYCRDKLSAVSEQIEDPKNWVPYMNAVTEILKKMTDDGHLYITGYPTFFAGDGAANDVCDKTSFFSNAAFKTRAKLNMQWETRKRMNDLVKQVNAKIQSRVVDLVNIGAGSKHVKFVDVEAHLGNRMRSHRFCEKGKGPGDSNAWFFDLSASLEETTNWEGPAFADPWIGDADGTVATILQNAGVLPNKYRQSSVFHPTADYHAALASALTSQIYLDQPSCSGGSKRRGVGAVAERAASCPVNSLKLYRGPTSFTVGLGPGGASAPVNVPDGCFAVAPAWNYIPPVVCSDGRHF